MIDKLTMDSIFSNEVDDFLDEMVALQLLENMECLQRSSRKRKHGDLLDDNEEDDHEKNDDEEEDDEDDDKEEDDEDDDEEEDDEDDEEDYDNEEEEDEDDSNCSEQTSASYASDARSRPNLEDPFANLDATMINNIKVLHAVLDEIRQPLSLMKDFSAKLIELNSKLLEKIAKRNGGTNGKL